MGVRIALSLQDTELIPSCYGLGILTTGSRQASGPKADKHLKMSRISVYVKESYKELTQKVSWPSWNQLQSSAIVVMVASVILAAIIFLMDFVFRHLVTTIYNLLY